MRIGERPDAAEVLSISILEFRRSWHATHDCGH